MVGERRSRSSLQRRSPWSSAGSWRCPWVSARPATAPSRATARVLPVAAVPAGRGRRCGRRGRAWWRGSRRRRGDGDCERYERTLVDRVGRGVGAGGRVGQRRCASGCERRDGRVAATPRRTPPAGSRRAGVLAGLEALGAALVRVGVVAVERTGLGRVLGWQHRRHGDVYGVVRGLRSFSSAMAPGGSPDHRVASWSWPAIETTTRRRTLARWSAIA